MLDDTRLISYVVSL